MQAVPCKHLQEVLLIQEEMVQRVLLDVMQEQYQLQEQVAHQEVRHMFMIQILDHITGQVEEQELKEAHLVIKDKI